MRVLLVTNGYPPTAYGGVEVYTRDVANTLAAQGHHVSVFCRDSDPDFPDYTLRQETRDGVAVTRLVNDFKTISSFDQTYQDEQIEAVFDDFIRRIKPEVIHFNHLIALSLGLPAIASSHGIPHLTTLHDYWDMCHRVRLQDWRDRRCPGPLQGGDCYRCVVASARGVVLRRMVFRFGKSLLSASTRKKVRARGILPRAISVPVLSGRRGDFENRLERFHAALSLSHKVLTPSEHIKRVFYRNGFSDLPMEVLPLGLRGPDHGRTPRTSSAHREGVHIGFCGTLIPDKGAHVLVEAFHTVQVENLQLHIYGRMDADPVYVRHLQTLANGDERIVFHGPFSIETRDQVYQSFDLLVIPSLFQETFSLVAREALLNGTPVAASDVGALPEIITEGVNGFLVPPDDVGSLASLLANIAQDPKRLQALELPGPTPILSVEDHTSQLERIYRSLI